MAAWVEAKDGKSLPGHPDSLQNVGAKVERQHVREWHAG